MALYSPNLLDLERMAQAAIEQLPPLFRQHLGHVILKIEDVADDEILAEMGIDNPFELSGLYSGHPVGEMDAADTGALPPTIYLYRRAILDEWCAGEQSLEDLVAHVVIHEIGHHFGLSDDDMHHIEDSLDVA